MQNVKTVKIREFKSLKDFNADINGRNIMILGENGLGKSSFTQFIKIALGDTKHIPDNTKGEGYIVTDRDGQEWTFNVKIADGKSKVEIISPEGLKDSRKGSLSALIGAVDFDINEFVELSKSVAGRKKQVEIFKSFLGEDIKKDLEKYEANATAHYQERADVNKSIKNMEGEIAGHPLNHLHDLSQVTPVDIQQVYKDLQADQAINNRRKEVESRMSERDKQLKEIEEQINLLTGKAEGLKTQNSEANKWLDANPAKNTTVHEEKINSANETNKTHEQAQQLSKKRLQLEEAKTKSGELTVLIDSERQAIADAIRDMATPVEGLSFQGDNLTYNGVIVSSDSLSTSEIEELGIRLKIAENPDFGILFIGKAESIGKDRMNRILEIAKKHGLQVIGEQVERQDEKRLHIEVIQG
jgi:hypothetical protein